MNIYVGNLSYDVTEEELREQFAAFGEVASVTIVKDKRSGQSKGFGFVEMPTLSQGQAAITGLNGKIFHSRQLSVSGARPRSDNRGNRSFYGSKRSGKGGRSSRGEGRKRYY